MKFVADLHIHSHYSRATSQNANPENIYRWAVYKGVTLVGAGDFTHPAWREELKEKLEPAEEEGLYRLKGEFVKFNGLSDPVPPNVLTDPSGRPLVRFMVSGEISTIYKKGGRVRKIHHLILLPNLQAADELSRRLEEVGNIRSDGRPILGLDSRQLLGMTLEACPEALLIPAHIWTPHFSVLGANSGFDSIEECYGDLTDSIYAVETGLSSDPAMNWRLAALDRFTLVSNSDAHSPGNLAREANLFDTELTYPAIRHALQRRNANLWGGTLEFFPEEGKYHYDGHRGCQVRWQPAQTRASNGVCSVCGRQVTVGVLHRVEELADREEGFHPVSSNPYASLVPLPEVIASALGMGAASQRVTQLYFSLLRNLGPELAVLREAPLEAIARVGGTLVAEAIRRMRAGEVKVLPGFDGEYGRIFLLQPEERKGGLEQDTLFMEAVGDNEILGDFPIGTTGELSPGNFEAGCVPLADMVKTATDSPKTVEAGNLLDGGVQYAGPEGVGYLAGLNREQREAVTAEKGPVVVMAGPGTGKTRTLVHRLAYLIKQRGVAPAQITAVTFTNKAAAEIRQRVAELLGEVQGVEALTVGTFHGICLDMLRRYAGPTSTGASGLAGHPQVTILDETDAFAVLAEVVQESKGSGTRAALRLQREISLLKSRGILPSSPEVPRALQPVYSTYQKRLAEYGTLDYDDLLLQAVDLVAGWAPGQKDSFTHLLVDEFQDVNPVQYRLVRLWAGEGSNLFLIGDPHQAIYGFRGADYRFFPRIKEDFPEALVFHLPLNYRSTPIILRAASGVIAHNPQDGLMPEGNKLVAARDSGVNGPPLLHLEVASETAEGIAMVREIGRLIGGATMLQAHGQGGRAPVEEPAISNGEARGFAEIAVLCRIGRQMETLEECFLKEGIPYRVVGRESFLDERPVREALTFSWCLINSEDDFHLFRCLGAGRFGLQPEDTALVREMARKGKTSAWGAVTRLTEGGASRGPALVQRLLIFREAIETYRDLMGSLSPEGLLARWLEENSYQEQASTSRLLRVAARFNDLPSFLRGVVLAQEADHERVGSNAASPEAVTLMTLHAAKGLEFPVVFIAGVEDGLLPLKNKRKGNSALTAESLAEERRLFYVGLTRARDMLILVSARDRTLFGTQKPSQPSPFLWEIPPDCLVKKTWADRAKGKQGEGKEKYRQLELF